MPDPRNRLNWKATCKVYPAIADLQAIEDVYHFYDYYVAPGDDDYDRDTAIVAVGKLRIITYVIMNESAARTAMYVQLMEDGTEKARLLGESAPAAATYYGAVVQAVLKNPQFLRFRYTSLLENDIIVSSCTGYEVAVY